MAQQPIQGKLFTTNVNGRQVNSSHVTSRNYM